jgi:phosphonate transport system permease protein
MQNTLNPIEAMYEKRPKRWWMYTLIVLLFAVALGWSSSAINYKGLAAKGTEVAFGIIYGITHPDTSLLFNSTVNGVPYLLLETVAIAVLGTLIGGLLAIPFSFLASENIMPKWAAFIVRAVILLIRTIPSLVWALVWIRVTGPGPFCGVVTQSICSIGMISKMYINAIQDLDTKILESLDAAGCTTFQKIRYGILPQLYANFVSTIIYRFDINIKDATTLGIVGAGGIGAALIQCINSRRWSMVGAFLFGMIILMLLIDLFSTRVRRRLARG